MPSPSINLLLVQADPYYAKLLSARLTAAKEVRFILEHVDRLSAGLDRLSAGGIDLVLLGLDLSDCPGFKAFSRIHRDVPEVPIVILSGEDDEVLAIKAVRRGAQDYLTKSQLDSDLLIKTIRYSIERYQAERALAEERNLLRTLVDSLPDQIYVKDVRGRFILGNQALAYRLGLEDPGEIAGKTDFDFFPPELAVRYAAEEGEVFRTGQPLFEREGTAQRDGRHTLTIKVPLCNGGGRVIGLVGIDRDVTERKQAETELHMSLQVLRRAMKGTIEAMALTVEIRDPYTAGHQRRVAELAMAIAQDMGLSREQTEGIGLAAAIHDIGKISIPAEILSKPGKITTTEFEIIKTHPQTGYDILKTIDFPWPIAEIVLRHHQRFDGSGYPVLGEAKVMVESSILGVADVVEAMSSHRPYRPALGVEKALEELANHRGTRYDPRVADTCLKLFKEKGFRFAHEAFMPP